MKFFKHTTHLLFGFVLLLIVLASCESNTTKNTDQGATQPQLEPTAFVVENTAQQIKAILDSGQLPDGSGKLYNPTILRQFYSNRGYEPAWTSFKNIDDALASIGSVYDDGLDPQDYRLHDLSTTFETLKSSSTIDAEVFALFDIQMSESLLTAAAHLLSGKVNPANLMNNWNIEVSNYKDVFPNAAGTFEKALNTSTIREEFDKIRPSHYMYTGLKSKLAEYRQYQAEGGWDSIPSGPTIKPGMRDVRIAMLRKRLLATHEMEPYQVADSLVYDARLVEIMKRVQKKYGIEADGNIGKGTTQALSIPVEYRIQQIKANMERGRWILHQLEDRFIAVNIAGFELYLIDDGLEVLTSPVMVGKYQTQTPVFKSHMSYIVLNPTWTVPRSLNAEYIAKQKKDAGYLQKENMEVVTYSGKVLDHKTLNWNKYTEANFPYMFRQKPGPKNALGEMKFMFPNDHSIYLHDTPSRGLFTRDLRAFSHGCIRTKEIYALAEELLRGNDEGWTIEKLKKEIATGKTITINLKERIPVLLLYWTAGIGFNQNFYFKSDIYERDDALIEALNQPFAFH